MLTVIFALANLNLTLKCQTSWQPGQLQFARVSFVTGAVDSCYGALLAFALSLPAALSLSLGCSGDALNLHNKRRRRCDWHWAALEKSPEMSVSKWKSPEKLRIAAETKASNSSGKKAAANANDGSDSDSD